MLAIGPGKRTRGVEPHQKRRLNVGLTCIDQQVEHPTLTALLPFDRRRRANLKFSLIQINR